MRKKPIFILLALFVLLMMVQSVFAMESDNYQLTWYVPMTGGGGAQMSSANYKVDITSGQSAVMFAYSPGYDLQMGFWGRWAMPRTHRSYLPNIRR